MPKLKKDSSVVLCLLCKLGRYWKTQNKNTFFFLLLTYLGSLLISFINTDTCFKSQKPSTDIKKPIISPQLSNIIRAQWLSDLGFQTSVGDVKRQICCPLCLIKFETMAEKADATGRFSWATEASVVNRASASHLTGLEVFGEEHNHTTPQWSYPQTAAREERPSSQTK